MKETERWTEIEHLPQWDEEFYLVYTAKKFGKWVMLKTLRPEYKDDPKYQQMIEQEFDTRYNLAHPNIIMINDFEDVPGIGRCIITDDVYGLSLRKLIDEDKVTARHISQLRNQLVDALQYIQSNHIKHHPLRPENIIFTENIENLKLIDVGYEQRENLTPRDVNHDIYNYGLVVREALDHSNVDDPVLRRVAERCITPDRKRRYKTIEALRMALDQGSTARMVAVVASVLLLVALAIIFATICFK